MGLRIEYQRLRTDLGLYVPTADLIILRPRLSRSTERSVLAHEIQHHLLAHRRVSGAWSLRQERHANIRAAQWLVDPIRLRDVQRWSRDPAEWCVELGVTGDIMLAYLSAA
ncbi:ImmA/IrrE family metallo-endopeptidase [Galbitalea sp. SE-J8]|uniref:ImmA/IrrE family metallo-endopeptidase n=1 Tax=Galbitalea sp. SE-J8 TaxID=3054952 RepID=UPI00259D1423|nr:ImmA/IrrE family metallo-endopeptidase [Galbitalea sp. SE-J8]MDM4761931.1 ImmA/IrrE family metallo-endopeptidase [Galbitalea sp. SE-J8]